jgi:MFS family permease
VRFGALRRPSSPAKVVSEIKRYLSSSFVALTSREFRLYAIGQAISSSGVFMQRLAQAWLVLDLTESGFMVGLTIACQLLPTLFLTALGGTLADRLDRRLIMIATSISAAVPAFTLGMLIHFDVIQVWMVMAAAVFQGLVDSVELPTRLTLVHDVVGAKLLANAVTLNNVIQDAGRLVGPAAAGILIETVGLSSAFFANAVTFLPVVVVLMVIRPRHVTPRTARSYGSLRDAVHYVASRRELCAALVLIGIVGTFGYNFQVLIPIYFRTIFDGSSADVGFGLTCMGLGGVIGGVGLAGRIKSTARHTIRTACALSLGLVLLALAPTLWLAYIAALTVGACSVVFKSTAASHVQLESDPYMRGRVMGLFVMALAGSSAIGGPMQGGIAQLASARASFTVAGVAVLTAALTSYWYLRRRRALDGDDEAIGQADDVVAEEAEAMVKGATA